MADATDAMAELAVKLRRHYTTELLREANFAVHSSEGKKDGGHGIIMTMAQWEGSDGDPIGSNSSYCIFIDDEVWTHVYEERTQWVADELARAGHADLDELWAFRGQVAKIPPMLLANPDWVGGDGNFLLDNFQRTGYGSEERLLLDNATSELSEWNGTAATAYSDLFGASGEYWHNRVRYDYALAEALVCVLDAKIALIQASRRDVRTVVDTTINALSVASAEEGEAPDASLALAIGAGILAVALAATGVGAVATAIYTSAFAVTGEIVKLDLARTGELPAADFTVAEDGIDGARKSTISGESVTVVMDAWGKAMNDRFLDYSDKLGEIERGISGVYNWILSAGVRGKYFQIILDEDDKDFGDATEKNVDSGEMMGTNLDVTPSDLVSAAEEFAYASSQFGKVAEAVVADASGESAAFGNEYSLTGESRGADIVAPTWADLRDLFQDIVAANGRMLEDIGQAFIWVAGEYVDADSTNAEDLGAAQDLLDASSPKDSGNPHSDDQYGTDDQEYAVV